LENGKQIPKVNEQRRKDEYSIYYNETEYKFKFTQNIIRIIETYGLYTHHLVVVANHPIENPEREDGIKIKRFMNTHLIMLDHNYRRILITSLIDSNKKLQSKFKKYTTDNDDKTTLISAASAQLAAYKTLQGRGYFLFSHNPQTVKMAYPFIPGKALIEKLEDFSQEDLKMILVGVVNGLDKLHQKNLLHMDLKLPNIVYDPETKIATLIDFELVKKIGLQLKEAPGNPDTIAPELMFRALFESQDTFVNRFPESRKAHVQECINSFFEDEPSIVTASPALDLYGFGVILYQLITKSYKHNVCTNQTLICLFDPALAEQTVFSEPTPEQVYASYQFSQLKAKQLCDLVNNLTQPDPLQRMSLTEIKRELESIFAQRNHVVQASDSCNFIRMNL